VIGTINILLIVASLESFAFFTKNVLENDLQLLCALIRDPTGMFCQGFGFIWFISVILDDSHGEMVKNVLIPQIQALITNKQLQASLVGCFDQKMLDVSDISGTDSALVSIVTK
jgi:hypothetical protein